MDTKVLIVDDSESSLSLMETILRKVDGCQVLIYTSSAQVMKSLDFIDFDIAVIDYDMPVYNGMQLINEIREHPIHSHKPVIMVTGFKKEELHGVAFRSGAIDFLRKPIEPIEFRTRIRNLINLRLAQREFSLRVGWLEGNSARQNESSLRRESAVSRMFLRDIAGSKLSKNDRIERLASLCGAMAEKLGLDGQLAGDIRVAAFTYFIYEIELAGRAMNEPTASTAEPESQKYFDPRLYKHYERHFSDASPKVIKLSREIKNCALEHWDGTGHPQGLKNGEIPISARIFAVAEKFISMTDPSIFKSAWPSNKAHGYILSESGKRYDPDCVHALGKAMNQILEPEAGEFTAGESPTAKPILPQRENNPSKPHAEKSNETAARKAS